jgi:hypothetical protein
MLRVQDQAKQAVHSVPPPSTLAVPRGNHSVAQNLDQEGKPRPTGRVQLPQVDLPMTGLHNSN